jgi:hypothetical protein
MIKRPAASPEQQALLQAVLGNGNGDETTLSPWMQGESEAQTKLWQRGLRAYRANGQALAERALLSAYPVLAQLLGDENLAMLARHFWTTHPPLKGDMACWGEALADFIDASPQLVDNPYLGDVARLEWLMHQAASAADVEAKLASFALLTTHDPTQVTLTLGAGVALLASRYPVASLVNAHLLGSPSLLQAGQLLQEGCAEHALVWREGFKPCARAVSLTEYTLIGRLLGGHSLLAALDTTDADGFDFNAWLGDAVRTGLICGAQILQTTQREQT